MKKLFILIAAMIGFGTAAHAQKAPEVEFAFEIKAICDPSFTVGQTQHGQRVVVPIIGGTFEGPGIKGKVLPGGADYQLVDREHGRTELEAIYCIQTDDGVNIHVRNVGISVFNQDGFYFRTVPKFEAPADSKYNWLNDTIFICVPEGHPDYISLQMWKVK